MRYMAAPQRSHCIASSVAGGGAAPRRDTTGVTITLRGEPIEGGTFSGGLSTAAIIRPQIGSERSSGYARSMTDASSAPGRICGHRRLAQSAGDDGRECSRDQRHSHHERAQGHQAGHHQLLTPNSRLLTADCYRPQPIWFATNQRAIIETGTPSNHATPYFITASLSHNSVIPAVQHTFQKDVVPPLL
jgi:hypothetical protein